MLMGSKDNHILSHEPDLKRVMIPLKGKYGSFGEKTAFSYGAGPGFWGGGDGWTPINIPKTKVFKP